MLSIRVSRNFFNLVRAFSLFFFLNTSQFLKRGEPRRRDQLCCIHRERNGACSSIVQLRILLIKILPVSMFSTDWPYRFPNQKQTFHSSSPRLIITQFNCVEVDRNVSTRGFTERMKRFFLIHKKELVKKELLGYYYYYYFFEERK